MRSISLGVVRNTALALVAVVLSGCGGGGGGGSSGGSAGASAPPPAQAPSGGSPAAPPPPSIAGPSILMGGAPAKFDAAGLPAGTAVTFIVRDPRGAESSYGAVVGDDGRLSQTVTPGGQGVHTVRMVDSSGRELAAADFIAN